jgi:uncharacterized membrane protein
VIRVTLFTKAGCKLCEDVKRDLARIQADIPHELVEVDIETDPALHERYRDLIPVVVVGPYTLDAPISEIRLRVALGAARDSWQEPPPSEGRVSRAQAIRLNRMVLWLTRHWLAALNTLIFLYVGLSFSAPALMQMGATRSANAIYTFYSPLCHQLAFRSWFMFGRQPVYPRALADLPYETYGEVTGLDEGDYFSAREFLGDEQLGYKVALCERDVAIYGGIFLAGIAYALLRKRIRPLPIGFWFLLGVLPIAIDGGSQLLAFFPVLSFPVRESTPFLRTLTGALFGVMNVWMAYPYVGESMEEVRVMVAAKLVGAGEAL